LKKIMKILIILVLAIILALWCVKRLFPLAYFDFVSASASKYNLNILLIESIIKAESNFNAEATSVKNAKGLMQVTDDTAVWCAEKIGLAEFDLYDARDNIEIGTYYFSYLLERYEGNMALAAAAYNAGYGNVDKWLKDSQYSKDGKNLYHIPYKETQRYVRKIILYNKLYDFIYREVLGVDLSTRELGQIEFNSPVL
jgi:soluble lytic murein transglycosylase